MLKHKYDPRADSIYITLNSGKYNHGYDLDDDRHIDYDENDVPIGIEILSVSHGVNMKDLPCTQELVEVLQNNGFEAFWSFEFQRNDFEIVTDTSVSGVMILNDKYYDKPTIIETDKDKVLTWI